MRPMGPGPHFGPKMKQFVPRLPFDMVLCESAFPKVKPAPDESAFTQVRMRGSVFMLNIYLTSYDITYHWCLIDIVIRKLPQSRTSGHC